METLLSRPYAGEADLQPATGLILKCRAVESIDPWPPIDDLRQHLRAAGRDRSADVRIWERHTGELAAIATIWDGMSLIFCIHPEALSEDLTAEILGWGLARARELARRRGEQAALFVPICAGDRQAAALLERHGFAPEDWELLRMIRSLAEPIAAPRFPEGFTLRPISSAHELAAATEIYQEVFVAGASIVRDRLALARSSDHIQAIDLVAVAPDGAFAAFCLCTAGAGETARPGRREGWIDLVGTRPAYRRLGLGRAVLLAGLQQLAAFGADQALLGTASWNVAAQRLFASVGFRLLHQVRWYAWLDDATRGLP
jgi:ribosomal protein S18 acetylase RimI-like enzyme